MSNDVSIYIITVFKSWFNKATNSFANRNNEVCVSITLQLAVLAPAGNYTMKSASYL